MINAAFLKTGAALKTGTSGTNLKSRRKGFGWWKTTGSTRVLSLEVGKGTSSLVPISDSPEEPASATGENRGQTGSVPGSPSKPCHPEPRVLLRCRHYYAKDLCTWLINRDRRDIPHFPFLRGRAAIFHIRL